MIYMKLMNFSKLNVFTLISHPIEQEILYKNILDISIVTVPGNLFWVQKDNFVFITSNFISNDDLSKILKSIISKKIMGCCIIYNNEGSCIDDEITRLCKQNNFPLFAYYTNNDHSQSLFHILSHIKNKDNILAFLEQQLKNNIACLMNSKNFNEKNLTYLVSLFLHRETYLLSKQFKLLCYGYDAQNKTSYHLPFKKWSEELSKWNISESYSMEPVLFDHNDQEYYCFPLKTSKNIIGYLCIEKAHPYLGEFNTHFITEILPNFILCMMNNTKDKLVDRKSVDEYLQSILYGLFTDENALKRETSYYHFEYYLNRYVWILQIEPLNRKKHIIGNQIPHAILTNAKNVMEQVFYENIFLSEKSQIVSIHAKDNESNEKVLKKFHMLINDLELQCPEYSFYIGISRAYTDIYQLKYAYEDSSFSLTIGKIIFQNTKKVFSYDDLLIYHFLYNQMNNPIIERLYVNTVQKIKIHDSEKQDQLYETLNELMNCDFNIKQAYENLYIHRNTLYQRMKKIEKIIGLSMKSSETKLLLQLGLKLNHIYTVLHRSKEKN